MCQDRGERQWNVSILPSFISVKKSVQQNSAAARWFCLNKLDSHPHCDAILRSQECCFFKLQYLEWLLMDVGEAFPALCKIMKA